MSTPDPLAELPQRVVLRSIAEAGRILDDGEASARDIEVGMMLGAGVKPGPFSGADAWGLDEVLAALEQARVNWGPAFEPPAALRRLVAQGRLGRKTGQGFFAYPQPDEGADREAVALETRGDVGIVWLDKPPANALGPKLLGELSEVWAQVDGSLRALVLASSNLFTFSAGADIKAFAAMEPGEGRALADAAHELFRSFERSSTVTIAAVNAVAYGGGCELAMACDVRLAGESATFGQPEIDLGLVPGFGGTQRLPRLVGEAAALEMNLSGQPIEAREAHRLGLANAVVPDHELLDEALAWAQQLASKAPRAVEAIKRVSGAADLDAGIEAEKAAFGEVFATEDASEGIQAFLAKRNARFQGR